MHRLAMDCQTWSSGWKEMLRSGTRVVSSHSCCRGVVGSWNSRQTGTPAGTNCYIKRCMPM